MVPLLERFRDVFSEVLYFDSWATPFLGLKVMELRVGGSGVVERVLC